MLINVCKSKIHRATVTDTSINYEGSITIAPELMKAANINPYEQVHVVNINNGLRFVTYVIPGSRPGEVVINGAAARLAVTKDKVIILAYTLIKEKRVQGFKPSFVLVDEHNLVKHKK